MAKEAVHLGALKEEIKNRKQGKMKVAENAGLPVNGKEPKDAFLKELLESLKQGQPGRATNKIKLVEQKTAQVSGEPVRAGSGGQPMSQAIVDPNPSPVAAPTDGEDRDARLYEEMERRKRELQQNRGHLNETGLTAPPAQAQHGVSLDEGYVNEVVARAINENVSYLVEQAMKDTIIEIYVGERMKETIMENEKMIENIVIETIRKLQKKKPA